MGLKVEISCRKHPRYQGKRKPNKDTCSVCNNIWSYACTVRVTGTMVAYSNPITTKVKQL